MFVGIETVTYDQVDGDMVCPLPADVETGDFLFLSCVTTQGHDFLADSTVNDATKWSLLSGGGGVVYFMKASMHFRQIPDIATEPTFVTFTSDLSGPSNAPAFLYIAAYDRLDDVYALSVGQTLLGAGQFSPQMKLVSLGGGGNDTVAHDYVRHTLVALQDSTGNTPTIVDDGTQTQRALLNSDNGIDTSLTLAVYDEPYVNGGPNPDIGMTLTWAAAGASRSVSVTTYPSTTPLPAIAGPGGDAWAWVG